MIKMLLKLIRLKWRQSDEIFIISFMHITWAKLIKYVTLTAKLVTNLWFKCNKKCSYGLEKKYIITIQVYLNTPAIEYLSAAWNI